MLDGSRYRRIFDSGVLEKRPYVPEQAGVDKGRLDGTLLVFTDLRVKSIVVSEGVAKEEVEKREKRGI